MPNPHLVLHDGDRQIDSWDIDPNWDALDVAEFLDSLGTVVYDYIRDLEVPDENVAFDNDELADRFPVDFLSRDYLPPSWTQEDRDDRS